jgi:hypothetical protein
VLCLFCCCALTLSNCRQRVWIILASRQRQSCVRFRRSSRVRTC